jgi:hypothetical protein
MSINKRLLSTLPLRTMSVLLFSPMYVYHNRVVFTGEPLRAQTSPKCLSGHDRESYDNLMTKWKYLCQRHILIENQCNKQFFLIEQPSSPTLGPRQLRRNTDFKNVVTFVVTCHLRRCVSHRLASSIRPLFQRMVF